MSTADELAKLDALRKSGVLTQGEFDAEKAKLLGGVSPLAESVSPSEAGSSADTGSDGKWYPPPAPSFLPLEAPTSLPPTVQARATSSEPTSGLGTEKRGSKTSLLVIIGIVVVVGIAVGAFLIQKGSSPSKSDNNTAAQANLQTALTGADTYYTADNQTFAGVYGGSGVSTITAIDTGLDYVPGTVASTDVDVISIQSEGGGEDLVLTAYAPVSGVCFGVLDVMSTNGLPAWLTDDYTGITVGTYYFQIAQASAGNCKATDASAAQTLYTNGWR